MPEYDKTTCWTWLIGRFNTLRLRQDGCRYPDDTFERIFLNENVIIFIKISLKFVAICPINNIPALVQIMAWRRPGDKPLTEPMMVVRLPTHICVTQPQWVKFHRVSQYLVNVVLFGINDLQTSEITVKLKSNLTVGPVIQILFFLIFDTGMDCSVLMYLRDLAWAWY